MPVWCSSLESSLPNRCQAERRPRRRLNAVKEDVQKGDERALAIPPRDGSPTVRMREECEALRRAAVVAMVQATEVWNLHDVAVVMLAAAACVLRLKSFTSNDLRDRTAPVIAPT